MNIFIYKFCDDLEQDRMVDFLIGKDNCEGE